MYEPWMYESHLDDVFDSYVDRIHEITKKPTLSDEEIEELKELIAYIDTDKDRRYINRR